MAIRVSRPLAAASLLGLGLFLAAQACEPSSTSDPEAPPSTIYAENTHSGSSFHPNPEFVPLEAPAVQSQRQALRLEGEVIVLEGDSRFVASNGTAFGITQANQEAIVQEVISEYGDQFDTIQIYLSFLDQGNIGSAYYQPIRSTVAGIGRMSFNGRGGWGLPPEGRLSGFSNMNVVDQFGPLSQVGRPFGGYHAVVAQELSHRWLFFFTFRDPAGNSSDSLLGRDDAHWSRLAQAYASVQDGNEFEVAGSPDDDGFQDFIKTRQERGFAPLDLYGLGVYTAEQVDELGPIWYISEATSNGEPLDRATANLPNGARVRGKRIDVQMRQVIQALGPRDPPAGTEDPYYRVALVFVTAPGQPESEWQPYLQAVQELQATFPSTWKEWSLGASAVCLKVTERCPEPKLDLHDYRVADGNDDLLAPGESFDLSLILRNDGLGTAENVNVIVESLTPGVMIDGSTLTVAAIEEAKTAEAPRPLAASLSESIACGQEIRFRVTISAEQGPRFIKDLAFTVGNRTVRLDPLNEAPDWEVDPEGADLASKGQWALGVPDFISLLGVVTQPAADNSPGEGELAFFTGLERGNSQTANDVDEGQTTLQSPVFAIGDTLDPSLVFYYWRVARDFTKEGLPAVPGSELIVQGSNDGGQTWVEMAKLDEQTEAWTRHTIRIRETLEPSQRVRFRFVIADSSETGIVEAGVDDIEIIDVLDECIDEVPEPMPPTGEDDEGCRCLSPHSDSPTSSAWLLILVGLAGASVLRRRP